MDTSTVLSQHRRDRYFLEPKLIHYASVGLNLVETPCSNVSVIKFLLMAREERVLLRLRFLRKEFYHR